MQSLARLSAITTMAATAALMAYAPAASAQALPPASEIVAKHIAAVGGKDAIMKITSMQQKGTMEIPSMGLTAQVEVVAAQPNKSSMKQTIPGMGEMTQGFDGTTAWSVNPMQGPRILAGKELEQTKEDADFQAAMLFAADRFSSMETVGLVDFNGEKAYKVKFVRKPSGRESIGYFSVANGWSIGGEMTQESEMGTIQLTTTTGDYKQFGPLKMPTKTEMSMGPTKMVMTFQDITFNAVPATAFELPAQVKALIKP